MISPQYAAGFFDGEGCVNLTTYGKNRQVNIRVYLINTDADILRLFQCHFGGRLGAPRVSKEGWKAFRNLVWTGVAAIDFLRIIQPFVILKVAQIKLALEYWDFARSPKADRCEWLPAPIPTAPWRTVNKRTSETIAKELEFKERMHVLNRKGA